MNFGSTGVGALPSGGVGVSARMLVPLVCDLPVRIGRQEGRQGCDHGSSCLSGIRRDRRVEGVSPPRKPYVRRFRPTMDAWAKVVDDWLIADRELPRKQRHTAQRMRQRWSPSTARSCLRRRCRGMWARRRVELGGDGVEVMVLHSLVRRRGRGRLRGVPDGAGEGTVDVLVVRDAPVAFGAGAFEVAFVTQAQEAFGKGTCRRCSLGPVRGGSGMTI